MIRVIATSDLKDWLTAQGLPTDRILRIMTAGQVTVTHQPMKPGRVLDESGNQVMGQVPDGPPIRVYDILLNRDPQDLPEVLVQVLRSAPAVIYVAEWDGTPDTVDEAGNPVTTARVLKGADPGYHKFAGWPV